MKRIIVIAVAIVAVVGAGIYLAGLGGIRGERVVTLAETSCQQSSTLVLLAQSVPTAQLIPCLTEAAKVWTVTDAEFTSEGSTVELSTSDFAGAVWTLTLNATCTPDPQASARSYPGQTGYQVVGLGSGDADDAVDTEWYQFEGRVRAVSEVSIPSRFDANRIFDEMDAGFVFAPRSSVNQLIVDDSDGRLTLDPSGTTP